jgi:hypothetical protein
MVKKVTVIMDDDTHKRLKEDKGNLTWLEYMMDKYNNKPLHEVQK